ncbi:NAD(P)H-hydrate epimerase [Tessaracoccus sp. OS52]|uniref:NAD(P)H-hydrate epimerase n=1 Tax=Tessaracoccus sp. OS52 TaxID=2886691 RepID=UPI001D124345|nr:NAD(P)H-hydrate epimerase [Tessaracoccus sp. OS52]MCC2594285.1 NAD(P)H-hydrate epimerase [Tessaracoccus sp. OS52]
MPRVITSEQMRLAEQQVLDADPDVDLMGRAARAVADAATAFLSPNLARADHRFPATPLESRPPDLDRRPADAPRGRVLVAVGPGNNGGDGLFAAAILAEHHDVAVWLTSNRAHPGGLDAARDAGVREVDAATALEELEETHLVIDAVLGIGGRPGLTGEVAEFARACESAHVTVISVDLPSGLDADSGDVRGVTFRARRTVTFAALKPCHITPPASDRCGRVVVADIGIPLP